VGWFGRKGDGQAQQAGLDKSTGGIGAALRRVFTAGPDADWDELEDSLILADVGAATTGAFVSPRAT
jgi:hypothetical protein